MKGTNMAVDIEKIKKMVEKISSLTVLELSQLVKVLMDKFGSRTSVKARRSATEVVETEAVSEEPAEVEEVSTKSEEESKPVPDPSSVPDPGPSSGVRNPSPVKRPEVEDFAFVYAWRYSGDNRYAKIGKTTMKSFSSRFIKTYHPTDDPTLIGIFKCNNEPHALAVEKDLLRKLKRTRPDVQGHEWVYRDKAFNEMIDKTFISDPNVLREIFGTGVEIEKSRMSDSKAE